MKAQAGLIATVVWCIQELTTAKCHDSTERENLLHGEDSIIGGNKAYADDSLKKHCRSNGVFYGINDKAKRNRSLSGKQKTKKA